MFVHAFVAAVGTGPEPAVFAFFNGGDEVFADFVRRGFRIAVFVEHDLAELLCFHIRGQQRGIDHTLSRFYSRWEMETEKGLGTDLRPNRPYHPFSSPRHPLPFARP